MDHKERVLKMLEDGKITAEEAFRLLENLDSKATEDSGSEPKKNYDEKGTKSEHKKSKSIDDIFNDISTDFQNLFNSDRINRTYEKVKTTIQNQEQAKQVFDTVENAFESVKNSGFDSMFSQGPKNRLIETINEDVNRISIDVTNGNVSIVPTERVTTVKFEVTPFYRKLDKKKNYFQDIYCEVKDGELNIVSDVKFAKVNVEVLLNQHDLKRLIVSGTNGNISLSEHSFEDLTVDILNGDIELEGTMTSHAFVRTSRGNVSVRKGTHNTIELISMVGQIETDELNARDVTVSANGAVNLTIQNQTKSVVVNSNMGNLNLTLPRDKQLEGRLSTVVGNLNYPPDIEVRSMKHQDIGLKEVMLINNTDSESIYLEASTKFGSVTLHRQ